MADEVRNVFISHVHEDDHGLERLKNLLAPRGFTIRDASISSRNPNQATDPEYIKYQILAPQIRWAGVMIVYISPKTRDSEWVNWEIEYAAKNDKRIIGVWAHGSNECDIPDALDDYADAVVGWDSQRIIDAISGKIRDWRGPTDELRGVQQIARYSCR